MRVTDLFEAPISHLEVHGMDAPGTYPDVDRRLLRNPQHIEKIKKHFAATDYDFNLYFVNLKGTSYVSDDNNYTSKWADAIESIAGHVLPEVASEIAGIPLQVDANAISVIYLSNANVTNAISMTPWIVAHRFGHALTDNPSESIEALISKLPDFHSVVAQTSSLGLPLCHVMTMRSARTRTLSGTEEKEELIAQYLIQGRISLQVPPNLTDIVGSSAANVATQLTQKSREIEATIRKILDACVGKMFIAI